MQQTTELHSMCLPEQMKHIASKCSRESWFDAAICRSWWCLGFRSVCGSALYRWETCCAKNLISWGWIHQKWNSDWSEITRTRSTTSSLVVLVYYESLLSLTWLPDLIAWPKLLRHSASHNFIFELFSLLMFDFPFRVFVPQVRLCFLLCQG